jgi:hypothetical protein
VTHSTLKPTKAQSERMNTLSGMRCICCEAENVSQPFPTEIDHLVDYGYRKHSGGHDATIPLCAWHHRGITQGRTADSMKAAYGPSFELQKRLAVLWYGTKRELLAIVDARLRAVGKVHEPKV